MQQKKPSENTDFPLHRIDTQEHDACALICAVRKGGQPTHGNVKRTIEALTRMGHRTGIDGEGDSVGILTDIPRQLWVKRLAQAGLRSSITTAILVAHVMIPAAARGRSQHLIERISQQLTAVRRDSGRTGIVNSHMLSQMPKNDRFLANRGTGGSIPQEQLESTLFRLQTQWKRNWVSISHRLHCLTAWKFYVITRNCDPD
jgi:glutamate synthase (NADPH/NADH) large chain